jgi:hypothetical protein
VIATAITAVRKIPRIVSLPRCPVSRVRIYQGIRDMLGFKMLTARSTLGKAFIHKVHRLTTLRTSDGNVAFSESAHQTDRLVKLLGAFLMSLRHEFTGRAFSEYESLLCESLDLRLQLIKDDLKK